MIIQCDNCKAKFRLNEDRIAGKGARVKCRRCSDYIIVMKPEYEHLKSEFIDGIHAEELKKRMEEEAPAEQPEEAEAAPPPPPAEKVAAEEQGEEEIGETATEESAVREFHRPPELEEDLPHAEGVSQETFRAEDIPDPYQEESQEASIDSGTPMISEEAEEEEDTQKDDMDMAFEKFLGSLRDESKISLDRLEQPELSDEQRAETKVADEDESAAADFQYDEEKKEKEEEGGGEERTEILSASETLDFISKDSDEQEKSEDFALKLEDEKVDFQDPFDLSTSVSPKPEIAEEEAGLGEQASESVDTWRESPAETLIQGQGAIEEDESFSEPVYSDSMVDVKESVPREKPSPYEYVPKAIVKERKRSKLAGFLMVLLFFMIIVAGAGAYLAFTKPGNDLIVKYTPQVRSLFGMKGGSTASPYDITNLIGYYETNKNTGKIFVIKGDVVNLSNSVNSGIVLKGQLLDDRSKVIKDKTVYAGNSLENNTLKNASKRSIEDSLQNKLGKNLSNIDIQPGTSVPFMIVFFDIPDKVEAYKVESIE